MNRKEISLKKLSSLEGFERLSVEKLKLLCTLILCLYSVEKRALVCRYKQTTSWDFLTFGYCDVNGFTIASLIRNT